MNKIFLIIIIIFIFFGAGLTLQYTNPPWFAAIKTTVSQHFGNKYTYLNKLDVSHYGKPSNIKEKIFSNKEMHITFNLLDTNRVTQINPQLISITNASATDKANGLLIYSVVVATDTTNLPLPFPVKGKVKSVNRVPKEGFDARQVVYTDGSKETVLLMLRQKEQLIVLRMPDNTKAIDTQAIFDIINSLQTIHQ